MKKVHGVIAALLAVVALLSCKVDSSGGGGVMQLLLQNL